MRARPNRPGVINLFACDLSEDHGEEERETMSARAAWAQSVDEKTARLEKDLLFAWSLNTGLAHTMADRAERLSDAVVKLAAIASVRSLTNNETLYIEGDHAERCYAVLCGCLRRVSILPDGRRHVVTFLHRGDLLGVGPDAEYLHTVEAVSQARLLSFPRAPFFQIAQGNPVFLSAITGALARKARRTTSHFRTVACFSAIDRVATFLMDYKNERNALNDQRDELRSAHSATTVLPMPRRDIADHLGLSLETVCRAMTKLRKRRLIIMPQPNQFAIPNQARLETYVLRDKAA